MPTMIDDFTNGQASGWRYYQDSVMGGVSEGQAKYMQDGDAGFIRLDGTVSTENNGGFIQIRKRLEAALGADVTAITLRLRGNGERYYVHLRPKGTLRPWRYYQAGFDTSGEWQEITLALKDFTPEGGIRRALAPDALSTIGIVAYGKDYEAQLDVAWVSAF